jgi:hypothetical protein
MRLPRIKGSVSVQVRSLVTRHAREGCKGNWCTSLKHTLGSELRYVMNVYRLHVD